MLLNKEVGVNVRYIYSACVVTTTPDVKILHDPWFTQGVYDGSWYQYPKVEEPLGSIGDVDLIYVSHMHPDHYDPVFLRQYFEAYGAKQIVIADHNPNYLASKMRADGFTPTILDQPLRIGQTNIEILPHKTGSISDIDSAIIIKYAADQRTHCVVNANDIIFDDATIAELKNVAGEVDILLCGYTGAGPYPQTYFDLDDPRLPEAAERKRQAFFDRYRRLTEAIGAKVNIPFAGKYILGGSLTRLNRFRGVADPVEVLAFDPNAIVLADNGGAVSSSDLKPTAVRTIPYDQVDIARREEEIRHIPMDYERLIAHEEIYQLPLKRLLTAAVGRAQAKSECLEDYYFIIGLPDDEIAIINANRSAERPISFGRRGDNLPEPRSEIIIDPRYLFGLLTHIYHWNNAEVGSQYATRRVPDVLNRSAQAYLNFLAV